MLFQALSANCQSSALQQASSKRKAATVACAPIWGRSAPRAPTHDASKLRIRHTGWDGLGLEHRPLQSS
eukprot:339199-Alexandrium_andersonii.AAC.1